MFNGTVDGVQSSVFDVGKRVWSKSKHRCISRILTSKPPASGDRKIYIIQAALKMKSDCSLV
jgi:hypothetical protein